MDTKPPPSQIFAALNAHQLSSALRGAIDLNFFDTIQPSGSTAEEMAARRSLSLRGVRILADYLVIHGLLEKRGNSYFLTPVSQTYLHSSSPDYLGECLTFFHSPRLLEAFTDVASCVRKGGTKLENSGSLAPDHPMWIQFASGMGSMMRGPARALASAISLDRSANLHVLDISASHGAFGFAVLQEFPHAQLTALDWPPVLEVTKRNAERAGLSDRFSALPGSVFDVSLTETYDVVLVPNFLHHFNKDTCARLLKKIHGAMNVGGEILALEFIPNDDRVSPPGAAAFALTMLCTTPEGDAYTLKELSQMFTDAGFKQVKGRDLGVGMETAVIAQR